MLVSWLRAVCVWTSLELQGSREPMREGFGAELWLQFGRASVSEPRPHVRILTFSASQ